MAEPIKTISRRDFLKLSGLAVLTTLLPKSAPDFVEKPGDVKEETPQNIKEINKPIERRVGFNEDGAMFLNGKPIVPIELYGLPGNPKEELSWQKAQKLGANMITMVFLDKETLTFAEKYNIKIMARLDHLFPEAFNPTEETKNLSEQELFKHWETLGYKERLEQIEENPTIVCWEVDEPDPWKTGQMGPDYFGKIPPMLHVEKLLSWLRSNDKNKLPVRVTDLGGILGNDRLVMLDRFRQAYDGNIITGADVYSTAQKILEISKQYDLLREGDKKFSKSNWTVVSAHSDLRGLTGFENIEELDKNTIFRSLVSSVVGGSRALCFYDNPPGCNNLGCVPNVPVEQSENAYAKTYEPLMTVINAFEPGKEGLLGSTIFESLDTPLALREMSHNGKIYIYAVNTGSEKQTIKMTGMGNKKFKELVSGKNIIADDDWTLTLPPEGIAVYVSE